LFAASTDTISARIFLPSRSDEVDGSVWDVWANAMPAAASMAVAIRVFFTVPPR
jgi:hypothetical protein